jgi:hypothetical protein
MYALRLVMASTSAAHNSAVFLNMGIRRSGAAMTGMLVRRRYGYSP